MQVLQPNEVKIYNLSTGKSVPEWLSDRKKRALLKKDVDLQKRINLVQDFEMPTISPDGRFIYAAGVYKPRIRCYDVSQLAMKFERCVDSEVLKLKVLSDDYSKILMLQDERYVEIHTQEGRYFRTRIPRYGRDFDYHYPSCEAWFVGVSSDIYRLNMELGRYMQSLKTNCSEILCCEFNPEHHLFTLGSKEGFLECWDPRDGNRVARFDCTSALNAADLDASTKVPGISCLKYRNGLTFAAGMTSGQVLLYDLRSDRPLLKKDHNFGLPIKRVEFCPSEELVFSMDNRILKIWDQETGKAWTSIEPPDTKLNDLCVIPNTGMLLLANEAPRVLTYYIPAVGVAPKWAGFLDALTEELEETSHNSVYDDYRFVTRMELENLNLAHLVGSNLLRAYMHGYFMDNRLYNKAKTLAEPFAFEQYRKQKIRDKIEASRPNRVQVKKLPQVNKELAQKLMELKTESKNKASKSRADSLLMDDRFGALFSDTKFEIDKDSEEFRLLNPVVSHFEKSSKKKAKDQEETMDMGENSEEDEGKPSDDEDDDTSSSEDEKQWADEVRQQHKLLKRERRQREFEEVEINEEPTKTEPAKVTLREGTSIAQAEKEQRRKHRQQKLSLADRLVRDKALRETPDGHHKGNTELTFTLQKKKSFKQIRAEENSTLHRAERKQLRRAAGHLLKKKQPWRRK